MNARSDYTAARQTNTSPVEQHTGTSTEPVTVPEYWGIYSSYWLETIRDYSSFLYPADTPIPEDDARFLRMGVVALDPNGYFQITELGRGILDVRGTADQIGLKVHQIAPGYVHATLGGVPLTREVFEQLKSQPINEICELFTVQLGEKSYALGFMDHEVVVSTDLNVDIESAPDWLEYLPRLILQ